MNKRLPYLAIILGGLLSPLVAAYSAYAGLKIGGVYWPILATSVTSMAILRLLGSKNPNLANILQTGANSGGMLAAGIIFTIPAAWMLGFQFDLLQITIIALAGSLLGLSFSIPLRQQLLSLPYPDGTAAATVLKSQDEGSKKIRKLTLASLVGGFLAILRDWLTILPSSLNLQALGVTKNPFLSINFSFIGLAGGFLIGRLFTSFWFAGSLLSYFVFQPLLIGRLFADNLTARGSLTTAGIGIIIGTALAFLVTTVLPLMIKLTANWSKLSFSKRRSFAVAILSLIILISIFTKTSLLITVCSVFGAFLMASTAAFVTGQLNIDPMEIFAIIVLLIVKFAFPSDFSSLIVLAALITIAAGVAGDIMQDYKTGSLLKTDPQLQTIAQIVGNLTASLTIGFIIIAIAKTVGFGTAVFPAPQATAIAATVKSQTIQPAMILGAITGAILSFILSSKGLGLAPIALGVGMYVPFALSVSLFAGGLIRSWSEAKKRTDDDRLAAAGLIAGESLVGVIFYLASFLKNLI